MLSRRVFLANSAAGTVALAANTSAFGLKSDTRSGVTFSFGTYGMKSLPAERAVQAIADIGFDGVELAALPDWDSHPANLPPSRRQELRTVIRSSGLQLTALSHNNRPTDDDAEHIRDLDRLKRVIELGQELSPAEHPLIQGIFGGGQWQEQKGMFAKRMADWAELAERERTVICIKPHRGSAMSRPSEAVWLIRQLGDTPWLRMVYDYSHYAFREMSIETTVQAALEHTGHIAVKDSIRQGNGTTFVLPGESGGFDYKTLFRLFYTGGYRGDISCEVSSAVWSKPGYDPLAAARTCYKNIAPILELAGVPRRR